ncbi:uncharacterized protein BKA78DRAFT_318682 [Phyllosticta capitalensis]|uniref:uncharacterized protein n=1 Tax=Phyllosticta capitalensis TaxID=121624 RepID=UPI00312F9B33
MDLNIHLAMSSPIEEQGVIQVTPVIRLHKARVLQKEPAENHLGRGAGEAIPTGLVRLALIIILMELGARGGLLKTLVTRNVLVARPSQDPAGGISNRLLKDLVHLTSSIVHLDLTVDVGDHHLKGLVPPALTTGTESEARGRRLQAQLWFGTMVGAFQSHLQPQGSPIAHMESCL